MNKFEQVSSVGHHMSLAEGPGLEGGAYTVGTHVQRGRARAGTRGGPYTMTSNALL